METKKYLGNSDVIRNSKFQWVPMEPDDLIVGKEYEIVSSLAAQWTYKMEDGKMVIDNSGERYRYYKVMSENNKLIYVWNGFFEGDSL